MKFDRSTKGEGVVTEVKLESGKAILQWTFSLCEESFQEAAEKDAAGRLQEQREEALKKRILEKGAVQKGRLQVSLKDATGQLVLLCVQRSDEEEPLKAVLLHPHVWSVEDPYLYELEILLSDAAGQITDCLKKKLPLYELKNHTAKGWLLNGEEITIKAVEYPAERELEDEKTEIERTKKGQREDGKAEIAENENLETEKTGKGQKENVKAEAERTDRQKILRDFRLLKELGVNCLHTQPWLEELCAEAGFLVWRKEMAEKGKELPCLIGGEGEPLSSLFYQYKAKWSKKPFVYLSPEEVYRLPSGNLQVTVYSNCNRVVLYTDGLLFEFQSGEGRFTFREVPAKGPCIALSAEGEECSMSVSLHKTFTKLSPNGDISTVK